MLGAVNRIKNTTQTEGRRERRERKRKEAYVKIHNTRNIGDGTKKELNVTSSHFRTEKGSRLE